MQTIQVDRPFVLTLNDGTTRQFAQGSHEVDDDIASHWYVKGHSTAVEPKPAPAVTEPAPPTPNQAADAPPAPNATPPKIPIPPVKSPDSK